MRINKDVFLPSRVCKIRWCELDLNIRGFLITADASLCFRRSIGCRLTWIYYFLRDAMLVQLLAMGLCLCVCLCILCHTPMLYRNGRTCLAAWRSGSVVRHMNEVAPQYLVDCCKSTTQAASRQRLRSASRHQLIVPRHRRSSFGRRAFSVAGPMVWNSLPDFLRDTSLSEDTFRRSLKTYFIVLY